MKISELMTVLQGCDPDHDVRVIGSGNPSIVFWQKQRQDLEADALVISAIALEEVDDLRWKRD